MALLDIQAMDPARDKTAARWDDGSALSVVLCDDDYVARCL
jgi:Lanthionine-containing peptide SapB precursor RamS